MVVVQWLRLHTPNAGGTGSIPDRGTKIPHAMQCSQKTQKKEFVAHTDGKRSGHTTPQRAHMGKHQGQSGGRGREGSRGKHRQGPFLWFPWEELVRVQAGLELARMHNFSGL